MSSVSAMKSRMVFWISNGLIVAGLAILLAVSGLWGYSQFEDARAAQEAAQIGPPTEALVGPVATPTGLRREAFPTATPVTQDSPVTFVPWSQRTTSAVRLPPTATPIPTPTPVLISPAQRIIAPSIHLDAKVEESPIVADQWVVPKFAAGHLQGTAEPLQGGNVVLAGHVQSISSGDVFANIARLRPGSPIQLYTKTAVVTYKVTNVEVVRNTDISVVGPSTHEKLTLITCTGTWLPLQHDYNERTVVIAQRVG